MSFLDSLFGKRAPPTFEEMRRRKDAITGKKAGTQQKLDNEKNKTNPDPLALDKLNREIAVWGSQLKKVQEQMRQYGYKIE